MYETRINLVLEYVRTHPAADLSVAELARIAAFSPYHFHRIFTALVGETVAQYVSRIRLERAVALLKGEPDSSILSAAVESGFQSASAFSRAFRQRYGIPARQWNRRDTLVLSEGINGKSSKNRQFFDLFPWYSTEELVAFGKSVTVGLEFVPELPLAYIRVSNSYAPNRVTSAYTRLMEWARNLYIEPLDCTLWGMSQDDPNVTPLELCRYNICLVLPESLYARLTPTGEVQLRRFPACMLATFRVQGDIWVVDKAWQYLYSYWLPHSRTEPANLPAIERYHRHPAEVGWEWYDLDCSIPIMPL
jgi:AraC family transcriptional regulator